MKRSIKVSRICALCMAVMICLSGCGKDFDAAGYVQAILDLTFQGDISRASEFMEEASGESLMRAYQDSIDRFVFSSPISIPLVILADITKNVISKL